MTAMAATKTETETFNKKYNTNAVGVYPTETLSFIVEGNGQGKPIVAVADKEITGNGELQEITYTVTTDETTPQGVYEYTIKEDEGTTAGVTYGEETIKILVMVDNEGKITTGVEKPKNSEKQDTITNTYNVKNFTVEKEVTGNMSVAEDEFEIVVTLTSDKAVGAKISAAGDEVLPTDWVESNGTYTYTKELTLSASDDAAAFNNIPYGVSVAVVETDTPENMQGYTNVTSDTTNFTINAELTDTEVVITNEKADTIATGIIVNNLPYILVLAGVVIAAVVLFRRKRYSAM